MKKLAIVLLSPFFLLPVTELKAQLKAEASGMYIKSGTPVSTDGLVMVPSTDLTLNDIGIQKKDFSVDWASYSSIQRLYQFSSAIPYSGIMGLNYQADELNGNDAAALTLTYTATVGSRNHKDFSLAAGAANNSRGYTEYTFTKPVTLASITAVTPDDKVPPFTELKPNNIISPNNDGVNDYWVIPYIQHYPNNEVKVFDRFGKIVFQKNGYENSWDGRYNGVTLPEDTYYYVLSINAGEHVIKGYIGVVRENNGL